MRDWGVAFSAYLAIRETESPQRRREVRRYRRKQLYDLFVRQPRRAIRDVRPLHLRMALARARGTLQGRAALRRETGAEASRRAVEPAQNGRSS
jgi:hypothetical protein